MHRWRVQVSSSDPKLLPYLIASLQDASNRIIEEDGQYYLASSHFDSFESLTAFQEFNEHADRVIARLNALLKLQFQVHSSIAKTGLVLYIDESGLLHLVTADTIHFADEIRGYAGDNFFQDASRLHPDLLTKWLEEGNDLSVDEALRYYANEVNWFNLYKIYEVIEHDIRSRQVDLTLLRQDKAEDFTYSANNFKASKYDARHSSKKFEKPSSKPTKRTTMSLNDAKNFIDDLLTQWLKTKL
jgi:hypothetical protein